MRKNRINRTILRNSKKAAISVAKITHWSVCFHFVDALFCFMRYGCEPEQYSSGDFYKLKSFERKNTYTIGRGYIARDFFNEKGYTDVLKDKVKFNEFFSSFVKRKWISCAGADETMLSAFVEECQKVIVKPTDGMKGHGIHLLSEDEKMHLSDFVGQKILFEEFIEQHSNMVFNNKSVNTIRLITLKDGEGVVHCLKAALRCGTGDSIVDNMSTGGVAYPVNVKFGRVEGPGLSGTYSIGNKDSIFIHPGTDTFMLGYAIPYWNEVIQLVSDAAKKLEHVRFVGWDVAVTSDGPELIEGNSRPGPATFEYMGIDRGFYSTILKCK